MRVNMPVTSNEYDYPSEQMLVSSTDTRGYITHCNPAFVEVSGFTYNELFEQNHNLIRHPDMPAMAFKDLWSTVGRGLPWTGIVKNRRKNGDFYWVEANVIPIMEKGKPKGYMSVRIKPSRQQVQEAQSLYAAINAAQDPGKLPFYLKGGVVYRKGILGLPAWFNRLPLTAHLGLGLGLMMLLGLTPALVGLQGNTAFAASVMGLVAGAGMVLAWVNHRLSKAVAVAQQIAADLAGCNLSSSFSIQFPAPMGPLMRSLKQIQINLRAVIGDLRTEIEGFQRTTEEIAQGSLDLSERTESQASSLQQTAASMEELSGTVKNTALTASQVADQSGNSTQVAQHGGEAVHQVGQAMQAIGASSVEMREIISVIEGIAFQTNILALNAAVEAARAGEQGRGFAVVAAEVRALAQRSASAAKEIRELIARSSEQISAGTSQMKNASATIDEVVKSVQAVGQLILQITNATKEQSVGISQVNEAVIQLDNVTQQNAALVEESAASADGLRTSSLNLSRAAQVFTL